MVHERWLALNSNRASTKACYGSLSESAVAAPEIHKEVTLSET